MLEFPLDSLWIWGDADQPVHGNDFLSNGDRVAWGWTAASDAEFLGKDRRISCKPAAVTKRFLVLPGGLTCTWIEVAPASLDYDTLDRLARSLRGVDAYLR